MSKQEIQNLNIDHIIADMSINPRDEINQLTVERYAGIIDEMPPLDVFDVAGEGLLLSAGFHRYEAHKLLGHEFIPCTIHQGNRDDAIDFADRSNAKNPLQLKPDELLNVCKRVLSKDPQTTNNVLRREYGIPQGMIKEVRKLINWNTGSFLAGNGELESAPPIISPYQKERHWYELHFSDTKNRRPTSLLERLQSCSFCGWPISVRAHLLDVAVWGTNEYTMAICVQCHEVLDMLLKIIEKDKTRAEILIQKLENELPGDRSKWYEEIQNKAHKLADFRKYLYDLKVQEQENWQIHTEAVIPYMEAARERGIQ